MRQARLADPSARLATHELASVQLTFDVLTERMVLQYVASRVLRHAV